MLGTIKVPLNLKGLQLPDSQYESDKAKKKKLKSIERGSQETLGQIQEENEEPDQKI